MAIEEEVRIAIYSYRASLRWAYSACFLISTLILSSLSILIELAFVTADSWHDTIKAIMIGIGISGAVSIILTIFVLEVSTVLADIVGRRKAEAERDVAVAERDAAIARRDVAETRLDAALAERDAVQAEVERLRRIVKKNGSN